MGLMDDESKLNNPEQQAQTLDMEYMHEQIKQRPVNKRRLVRRSLITAFLAVLFGVVACFAFLLLRPLIENKLYPPEEPVPITFSEEPAEDVVSPEDMIAEEKELYMNSVGDEVTASLDTEKIREEVLEQVQQQAEQQVREQAEQQVREQAEQQVREQAEQQVREQAEHAILERDLAGEYIAQYRALSEIAAEASRSLVTVTTITSDYDWVGDVYLDSGRSTGLIIAETEDAYLILTEGKLDDADRIRLTFSDGVTCYASIRAADDITGLTILEAARTDVSETDTEDTADIPETDESVRVASLGSSARSTLLGRPVIAIGAPSGTQGSVNYGIVTNQALPIDVTDSICRLITTDIYGSTQASGVLIDTNAEIIGWITMRYNREDSMNLISAIGITELKPLIEKLSNADSTGYFGIHAADVPLEVNEEQGVPFGVYITRVEMDSPAMQAGLQSGDVVVSFDGKDISMYRELVTAMMGASVEEPVPLDIMRLGATGYEPAHLEITPVNRITAGE